MNIIKLFFIGVVTAILNKLQTLLAYIDNRLINLTLKIMDREREEDEQQHEQQEQGGEQAAAAEQQQRLQGDRQLYMDIMDHDFDSDDDDEDFEIEEAQGDFSDNELEDDDNEEEENEDDADDDDDSEDTETEAEDGDEAMSVEEIRAYTVSGIRSHLYKGSSIYTFKPLRLIRCYFTMRNSKDNHNALPISRSGHRVIASESHLYSLGGYNPRSATISERLNQCQLFQELWSFNFATNRWKLVLSAKNTTNIPKELASTALVIYNNVLISHGGTGYPFGEICSNDCYAYSVSDNKPSVTCLKVTGDLPTAQYGPGIVIHKNFLYTIGGTTGYEYSCDVFRLDLTTKKWENVYICRPEMRDDPEGRYRHEVVYDGTHIYVLGGGTSLSVYDLKRLPAFNLNTNTWDYFDTLPDRSVLQLESSHSVQAGYPKPRKCFSCVQHKQSNGDIEAFIAGGLQADFKTYFADIWKLNLRTKQWTLIRTATLPKPLYFHSAAHAGNGCMYIFGGIEYSKKDMRRRNHLYKMWMTIPKLSEMCWDAITYYNENLNCFDMSTLLREGIPKEYLKRLPPQEKTFPRNSESTVFKTCAISTSMEQN